MYSERIKNLRKAMVNKGIDGVLLISDPNRNYMSGFTGDESFSIITLDKAIFITDSRFTEQAKQQVNENYEVVQYSGPFSSFLGNMVEKLNISKLGFEEDIISVSIYDSYKKSVKAELVPLGGMVEELRMIKDENEVDTIKKAAAIADKAFSHMLKFIKKGMTEREVGLELEFTMKKLGAKDLSFPSIIASGERSCLPHGQATDKILKEGEFLTMDFGCVFNDYCSDMTRTIVIGKPNDKMKEIYDVVLKANKEALKVIKSGVTGREVDKVARDIIASHGYGENFGHGLGHGVGRQIHEGPRVSPASETVLKSGMIVTDEPGIYIPGFGGVRIEDLIVVKDDGCVCLSESPKELICL
ncbi:Xaa-Pro aminopeptidase [Clostridium acetobutylicum]|uniref:Aminopeptidase P AMPP/PEPQ family enzyme, YQHT B.subtilis ortholog n=1 Tax=Clostridium acetobutylicum (strain ATCC 824 / DSM 792 / JCM 1419 / IAM 19013 / LMG 5710 / NBRC 13948 / NRRL B-527 / VKM B-1787 / 2291 / W) TaxID=272562 RepID=Q97HB7_CLOAB|nr:MULTISPECIES: Xaa-Pro peptidase family protein [Clostridium]AAK80054.1 Aminopeptidase P AMPP/PEPQ family enzyme, YQHT B.subtilis ortholog [Clostridium acetobutylicum ATCC 824]ADZ21146.1 Aminopeptidase P AMPP/PEPQ family enzyme [Clostridium acetobutylicum EA 2018]AEI34060.1 aminopeptidase P [Clostridium acetobutylicum DSM 1731]AWV79518.1 aminopeptidase P family protein [Clostridium acetobutylicum]MBC2394508.1 aminopeptidase P family protein [Clostridium acetobutylicum]